MARITHHSDEAYVGALAIAAAVRLAALGRWRGGSELTGLIAPLLPDTKVRDRLAALAVASHGESLGSLAKKYGSSGYVVEAIPLAICAAERMGAGNFFPVLRELISAGGDTDTIAALAGQIGGAMIGASGLPLEQVARVAGFADVDRIANQFVAALNRRT